MFLTQNMSNLLATVSIQSIAFIFSLFAFSTASFAVKPLNVDGLVAAVFTPFDSNLQMNLSVVPSQAAFLKQTGVEYAYIAGTTGESVSLSLTERQSQLEKWIDIAPDYDLKIIVQSLYDYMIPLLNSTNIQSHSTCNNVNVPSQVHVGANSLDETRQLTQHAVSLNSPHLVAFASMPTTFFKPATIESLVVLMASIASEASNLPFYYYHIPSMTGVEFSMYDFVVAAGPRIPNLVGVKYTGLYGDGPSKSFPDVLRLLNYVDEMGRSYEVMTGRDEMIIQCLVTGIKGFIGSQYNFAGELYNSIIKAYNNGEMDEARQLMYWADNLLSEVSQNVTAGVNGVKYMMVQAGVNVGDSRLPFLPMSDEQKMRQNDNLKKWCQGKDVAECRNWPLLSKESW